MFLHLTVFLLDKYPKKEETTKTEADEGRQHRIDAVLEKAGLASKEDKESYCQALSFNLSGYTVVYARDIDELMINPYNPEITMAWDGNTDFQFCFDFYALITYITEYFTKDDNGVVKIMVDTMKASDCVDLKDQMKLLMNTWIKNRQMGECEAVYHLNRDFKFRDSDTKCIFVQTCQRNERSKILKNVTGKEEYANIPKIGVENHVGGEYVEQYDVNSKYERRDIDGNPELDDLSFSHMAKMYGAFWGKGDSNKESKSDEEDRDEDTNEDVGQNNENIEKDVNEEVEDISRLYGHYGLEGEDIETTKEGISDEKFKHVLKYPLQEGEGHLLPKIFKLKDPFPGEPPYMKIRRKPAVLRFHKYNAERNPDAYWYSEALLYLPHRDETDLQNKIAEAKEDVNGAWVAFVNRISHVKAQVMEYIEDNEEARLQAAEMFIDNALTGEFMDPQGEQENDEDKVEAIIQREEFEHLDPETSLEHVENVFEKRFRHIEVRPLVELRIKARRLDLYQRKVLEIGIRHARALVKARGGKNPPPQTSPLVMVDGAAGAGKSCTINILNEILRLILQQPGDNPDCPYILLCAPTGTAAVNVKGQTLHTAFGFTWGDQHLSLSDKSRDTKRALFKNLKFLIIDEISMVRADQLLQIDLRLREITMRPNRLFGGVSLFFFGDIMQLKPVKGAYIWLQPRNSEFHQAFFVQSHWEQFEVISLVENHRQEGDKEFANILNRTRVGENTESDMEVLQSRVRPEGHPDLRGATVIASTHRVVNKYNRLALDQIAAEQVGIEAINSHNNIQNFRPKINEKKGTVGPTAYLQTLQVKRGCRVMMIDNIDISDCLCNGSTGTLIAIIKDSQRQVKYLMVQFDNKDSGQEMRRGHPELSKAFPGCTPLNKQIISYTTSANAKGFRSNTAIVKQFPLIICFASTTHKIQGQTIIAPRKVAVDLRTVFGANQAYVMLGRVQQLDQLYIIGSLPENKIYVDKNALEQLEIMKNKSLNENRPMWEKNSDRLIRIYYHNIQSIRDKTEDIKRDTIPFFADVMIFAETWLEINTCSIDAELQLEHYSLNLNSTGRGKGLAVYFRESKFQVTKEITNHDHQISKLESENLTVITLYRSKASRALAEQLRKMIPANGNCLVIGDLNICSMDHPDHNIFEMFKTCGLWLLINEATHLKGGHIDQAWIRCETGKYKLSLYSPYYTCRDHDALLFTLFDTKTEEGKWLMINFDSNDDFYRK